MIQCTLKGSSEVEKAKIGTFSDLRIVCGLYNLLFAELTFRLRQNEMQTNNEENKRPSTIPC